jgi:hypothetical protein
LTSLGHATEGPGFWTKALLQKAMRQTRWAKRKRVEGRKINFRLDNTQLGEIIDLKAA